MVTFVYVGASIVVGKRQSDCVREERSYLKMIRKTFERGRFFGENTRARLLFFSSRNYEQKVAYERFLVLHKQII